MILSMMEQELQVARIIQCFLNDALCNYEQLLERTKIVRVDQETVEVEIGNKSLTFQISYKKTPKCFKDIDDDNYYENVEIAIEISKNVYEEVRTYDSSIKHFWIALLDFNDIY